MHTYIEHKIENNIGYIHLNRPQAYNALIPEMIEELFEVLNKFKENVFVRVIILSGHGKSFCAGADISWMKKSAESDDQTNKMDSRLLADLFYKIYHSPKPVIAVVYGPVFGGGIGLMACCDLVVSDETSRFKFSEVRLGIVPSTIMPYVTYRMGRQPAKNLILTAALFDFKKAKRLHLIDYVVKQDAFHYAQNLAADMIKGAPEALAETKRLMNEIVHASNETEVVRKTVESLIAIKKTKNAKEGLQAFIDKRDPEWA